MNTTKKLMALVLAALACMSANAQDHGRENGFGIRLTGEMTSKIDVNDHLLRSEVFGDTAYLFFPTTGSLVLWPIFGLDRLFFWN